MMNECSSSGNNSMESEKPVEELLDGDIKFPPFPEPTEDDFDEDIEQDERLHYKKKFKDLNRIVNFRLHCTACDRHLGCSPHNESRIRPHPMLRTLMCHTCNTFYNSGEFEKGDDGSELYCRWCGQGGQVFCCSACPHVFCVKCIKRNLGVSTIKQIEETDDWKCFMCNNFKYLWDLRAICWAVLRYCYLKTKITYKTEDPILKAAYEKECALDHSQCCIYKLRRKDKSLEKKKEKPKEEKEKPKQEKEKPKEEKVQAKEEKEKPKVEKEKPNEEKNNIPVISKPSKIQVKKFASINAENRIQMVNKKAVKRPASPKNTPGYMVFGPRNMNQAIVQPVPKKVRIPNTTLMTPVRFPNTIRSTKTYKRTRQKPPNPRMMFNGFNSNHFNDNINLSLESLTQGLDMATVAGLANNTQESIHSDVVCTPDLPSESLSEVTEDNNDDDVQCMGPVIAKTAPIGPPPLIPRNPNLLSGLCADNIIQMTENDVTVNAATGGLIFRVQPQTLSANKMYRLPDGRIFAINANPNMPGGYSATVIAVTDESFPKMPLICATYPAKLSSVGSPMLTPPPLKTYRQNSPKSKRSSSTKQSQKKPKTRQSNDDVIGPVEWYRYNLIDAVETLEHSLVKLNKLKQEATPKFLRTLSVSDMRNLHKRLDRLLNTSSFKFDEIRDNINKEMIAFLFKKLSGAASEHDDDDVEILQDDNDDPIFIDENSVESVRSESEKVDLTIVGSDPNDTGEKSEDINYGVQIVESLCVGDLRDSDDANISSSDIYVLPHQKLQSNISNPPDKSVSESFEKLDAHLEDSILPDNYTLSDNSVLLDRTQRLDPAPSDTEDDFIPSKLLNENDIEKKSEDVNGHNAQHKQIDDHTHDNISSQGDDAKEIAGGAIGEVITPTEGDAVKMAVDVELNEDLLKDHISDHSNGEKNNEDSEMTIAGHH